MTLASNKTFRKFMQKKKKGRDETEEDDAGSRKS